MFYVEGMAWVGFLVMISFPILAVRDIIRAIKKRRKKRKAAAESKDLDI